MAVGGHGRRNWFAEDGRAYALFRPEYPYALSTYLAGLASGHGAAVDVGCGNGQLTRQLARHFDHVTGVDVSAVQIANAMPHGKVGYLCAAAEAIPLPDRSVDLTTAAQAAHWFDLKGFYGEVRRVSRPGAVVALISYGLAELGPRDLNERFRQFFFADIGPYWSPERRLVDGGYAELPFPFEALPTPQLTIDRAWELGDFLGYISTWSATRRAIEAGAEDLLSTFTTDLLYLWGPGKRPVSWPLNMRLGRV